MQTFIPFSLRWQNIFTKKYKFYSHLMKICFVMCVSMESSSYFFCRVFSSSRCMYTSEFKHWNSCWHFDAHVLTTQLYELHVYNYRVEKSWSDGKRRKIVVCFFECKEVIWHSLFASFNCETKTISTLFRQEQNLPTFAIVNGFF